MLPYCRQQLCYLWETSRGSFFPKAHLQNRHGHRLTKLGADQNKDRQSKGVLFFSQFLLQAVEPHSPAQLNKVLHSQLDHALLSQRHTDIPAADT